MCLRMACFILTALTLLPVSYAADAITATTRTHRPIVVYRRNGNALSSLNWSGYAVTGAINNRSGNAEPGAVTDAKGSWIVPAVQGPCQGPDHYAATWVGMDGFSSNSNTVEQIGTESDCINGQPVYDAWFEFFPGPVFIINTVPVTPGDVINAEVMWDGSGRTGDGKFTVSITDVTTGKSFSIKAAVPNAQRTSAQWITEAAALQSACSLEFLPLTNFGTVNSGYDFTLIGMTNTATVDGNTGPIRSFANYFPLNMVTGTGVTKAQPSGLSPDGTSFQVFWYYPGGTDVFNLCDDHGQP